jgi:hypothetical protein
MFLVPHESRVLPSPFPVFFLTVHLDSTHPVLQVDAILQLLTNPSPHQRLVLQCMTTTLILSPDLDSDTDVLRGLPLSVRLHQPGSYPAACSLTQKLATELPSQSHIQVMKSSRRVLLIWFEWELGTLDLS